MSINMLEFFCESTPQPEPPPETIKVILNLVQDQGLATSGSSVVRHKFIVISVHALSPALNN